MREIANNDVLHGGGGVEGYPIRCNNTHLEFSLSTATDMYVVECPSHLSLSITFSSLNLGLHCIMKAASGDLEPSHIMLNLLRLLNHGQTTQFTNLTFTYSSISWI